MFNLNQSNFSAILNSYVVLGSFILPSRKGIKDSRMIFIDRGKEEDERYVVAYQCKGENWWVKSQYFKDRNEALDYFVNTIKREYNPYYGIKE